MWVSYEGDHISVYHMLVPCLTILLLIFPDLVLLTSYRAWAAFHGDVCWHIVSSNAVQFVITCYMLKASSLALPEGSNLHPSLFDLLVRAIDPLLYMI